MNEEIRLLIRCIQQIKSIEATLTDITPATVSNDLARAKCTWYINDCQQRIDDINFTESPIVNYEALAEHEAQTFDEPYDGVPADTTKGGQL